MRSVSKAAVVGVCVTALAGFGAATAAGKRVKRARIVNGAYAGKTEQDGPVQFGVFRVPQKSVTDFGFSFKYTCSDGNKYRSSYSEGHFGRKYPINKNGTFSHTGSLGTSPAVASGTVTITGRWTKAGSMVGTVRLQTVRPVGGVTCDTGLLHFSAKH